MNTLRKFAFALLILGFTLGSCNQANNTTNEETTEEHNHESHEHHDHGNMQTDENAKPTLLPIAEGAKVFFVNLQDGDEVKSPVKIVMGLEGMEVEPAGELNEGKGHHHIVINGNPVERGAVVPTDDNNIHYGKGQTEAELELQPGNYSLTLQFADGFHQSYGPDLSATVNITVK